MKNSQPQDLNDEAGYVPPMIKGEAGGPAIAPSPPKRTTTADYTICKGGYPIAPLLDLTRDLRGVLVPVEPGVEFRDGLYRRLVAEARRQRAVHALSLPVAKGGSPPALTPDFRDRMMRRLRLAPGQPGRRWAIGAAAVGSAASLVGVGVGVLAYVRRHRQRPAA